MCYDCGIAMRFLEVDAVALWHNCWCWGASHERRIKVKPNGNDLYELSWEYISRWDLRFYTKLIHGENVEVAKASDWNKIETMRKVSNRLSLIRVPRDRVFYVDSNNDNELATWSVPMSSRHTYAHLQIVNIPSKEKLGLTSSPTDH